MGKVNIVIRADVSELADEADSKSVGGNVVRVQVPPSAFLKSPVFHVYWDPEFLL